MPTAKGGSVRKAFLNIDINDARGAYYRAVEFVSKTNLRYGLSSDDLESLGGREKQSVPELYASDYEWKENGRVETFLLDDRVVVQLFPDASPLAVENFLALVVGKGKSKNSGKNLHYKGCRFHRVVKDFVVQGGDLTHQNGSGGESIWGKKFKDDQKGLKLKHNKAGILSMCNNGKNSNSSQFFFTLAPCPKLDGKHVVFGEVIEGMDVLKRLNDQAGTKDGEPAVSVAVWDCGLVED
mmetsp:Transcript_159/g.333  ORF Transcript_159/g.333 Transcript_159/m.333 type:complete len:239 (+) Transcript_159:37-753(+)